MLDGLCVSSTYREADIRPKHPLEADTEDDASQTTAAIEKRHRERIVIMDIIRTPAYERVWQVAHMGEVQGFILIF